MNAQPSLFDTPGAPFQGHSEASYEAAEFIAPHIGRLQSEVLAYIRQHPRSTDAEIIAGLEKPPNSIRPRRIELSAMGLVRQAGTVTQPNGRRAAVWVAA